MIEPLSLLVGTMLIYLLVLTSHGLRHRFGLALFYGIMGGLTSIMAWSTDAGLAMDVNGVRFLVGSAVFYTSLMLGIFVIYTFEGPSATRVAILTVVVISTLTPITLFALRCLMNATGQSVDLIPLPDLRLNVASVITTLIDFIFLAIVWEYLGNLSTRPRMGFRAFFTLVGVMSLDVLIFTTAAFGGSPDHLIIMAGTFVSRMTAAVIAFPFLYGYMINESNKAGNAIEQRPVLAIFQELKDMQNHLGRAYLEIQQRKKAEAERDEVIAKLQTALAEVKTLKQLLPICSHCKKVRDDQGYWNRLDSYIEKHTDTRFTHGICSECTDTLYPGLLSDRKKPLG